MKNQDEITVMYDAAQMAERREQRRYEIAKELFTQDVSAESELKYAKTVAQRSIKFADALLAELERTK